MNRICLILILIVAGTDIISAQQLNLSGNNMHSGGLWVGAATGPGWLVEKAPDSLMPEIQDYFNKLRSGWNSGFETGYFINDYIGFGAKYSMFNTKQQVDSIVVEFFSNIFYINLSSDMKIHTLSPMVYGRLPLFKNKLSVNGGIGTTWLFYRNIGKAVNDSAMFKGSSPGLSTVLHVSYEVFPNFSLDVQGSYIHAFLKEFTQDDGNTHKVIKLEKKDYQNLSRIDLSFGIVYTFRRK